MTDMDQEKINLNQKRICKRIRYLKNRILEVLEHPDDTVVFNNPQFCDFNVLCGSETFYVSKCFLAQKSLVFASMFTSGMKEVQKGELIIVDDVEAVKAMLLFIHQNTEVDNVDLAMKVIRLAHLYEIKLLMIHCELLLLENIDEDRAEECLLLARKLKIDCLVQQYQKRRHQNCQGNNRR
ncbi:unnamed protein product [Bursaphelenchus okinawaensis]|uniref:BTB domain-containing protein n=1 Tax=Bursaphelenchus okinawaensis TaxID=465554 RepID=A0A811JR83_9BILA|nr:unnamed protein product [Bursaphelenchus okinawaensis]CAG9079553.1 unnamed protein product [Bursaphelenchus okinawaensis]